MLCEPELLLANIEHGNNVVEETAAQNGYSAWLLCNIETGTALRDVGEVLRNEHRLREGNAYSSDRGLHPRRYGGTWRLEVPGLVVVLGWRVTVRRQNIDSLRHHVVLTMHD